MKKILIIPLLFMFACHADDDETIAFLDEGIESCNSAIDFENEDYFYAFDSYIKERPQEIEPYKINTDKIKILANRIFDQIKLNKNNKTDLTRLVNDYKNITDSLFIHDPILQKKETSEYNIKKQEYNDLFIYNYNLLKNKIITLNYLILNTYLKKVEHVSYRFVKKKVVLVPKIKYLNKNEIYEAEIFFVSMDTTFNWWITADSKNIESKDGQAFYYDSVFSNIRKVNQSCNLKYVSPSVHDTITYKFFLKYQFIEK